jgi:hypothetical protein
MKLKQLLYDYYNHRISGDELRTRLAKAPAHETRKALAILNVDEVCRKALLDFAPDLRAADRLAKKIGSVEAWATQEDQKILVPDSSKPWLFRLMPALDVIGHSQLDKLPKKRKVSPSVKKKRSGKKAAAKSKRNL